MLEAKGSVSGRVFFVAKEKRPPTTRPPCTACVVALRCVRRPLMTARRGRPDPRPEKPSTNMNRGRWLGNDCTVANLQEVDICAIANGRVETGLFHVSGSDFRQSSALGLEIDVDWVGNRCRPVCGRMGPVTFGGKPRGPRPDSIFTLQFNRGELQQDGIEYFNDHVLGAYNNAYSCVSFCDPTSGFLQEAAGGVATGPMTQGGLEPWIMLSEVQFLTTAVLSPPPGS